MESQSHDRLCLTCNESKSLFQAQSAGRAEWVFRETKGKGIPLFSTTSPLDKNQCPPQATLRVTSYVPKRLLAGRSSTVSRKVLYWASMPSSTFKRQIQEAPKAYGKAFRNHGITTVQPDGKIHFKIETPQPYTEERKRFPAHVHFVFASKIKNFEEWDRKKMFVMAAFPGTFTDRYGIPHSVTRISQNPKHAAMCSILLPSEVRKHQDQLILINALPKSSKEKRSISDSSIRVPYNQKGDAAIRRLVQNQIKTRPYVVYCAHSRCSAASILIKRLVAAGAVNAYYMPAGIRGWHRS